MDIVWLKKISINIIRFTGFVVSYNYLT